MFRLWGKMFKSNRLIKDMVYATEDYTRTRTARVFDGLETICYEFDLSKPLWLDATIEDFRIHGKCRFTQDNFVEQIDFDYLELQIIEE